NSSLAASRTYPRGAERDQDQAFEITRFVTARTGNIRRITGGRRIVRIQRDGAGRGDHITWVHDTFLSSNPSALPPPMSRERRFIVSIRGSPGRPRRVGRVRRGGRRRG